MRRTNIGRIAAATNSDFRYGTKRTWRTGRCMSVIGGKAEVLELGPDFRF